MGTFPGWPLSQAIKSCIYQDCGFQLILSEAISFPMGDTHVNAHLPLKQSFWFTFFFFMIIFWKPPLIWVVLPPGESLSPLWRIAWY